MSIVMYGETSLGEKSGDVLIGEDEIDDLVDEMVREMHDRGGVGLAAPQVGENLRIFVWNHDGSEGVAVNPSLSYPEASIEAETALEGCLSAPGVYVPMTRPARVTLRAQNLSGKDFEIEAEGVLARIFQHEMDHLDGNCIMDLLNRQERRMLARRLRRSSP